MELKTAIQNRHSVRAYLDKPIEEEKKEALRVLIDESNKSGGLHIQLVTDEPEAFSGFMARYGNFSGVKNYIALVGKSGSDETIGYYGAKIMLAAQSLGLNTCWVEMSYKKVKTAFLTDDGEKLKGVIALGYGSTQGVSHKIKTAEEVSAASVTPPEWFAEGIKAALAAPTAMNQQRFFFTYLGEDNVRAVAKSGFYTKMDLGIAKYFFEVGAEHTVTWH